MERYRPIEKAQPTPSGKAARSKSKRVSGGAYFPPDEIKFIPSGCTLLDCVLGGGWVLGRVENVIGDTSSGKTLLAIEACANMVRNYSKGKVYYRESESAFDLSYAAQIGLPVGQVDFGPKGVKSRWRTIEAVFEDLKAVAEEHAKKNIPGLYVIDSLDALSSETALKRKATDNSFHLEKQKVLAHLFEQLISEFKAAQLTIMIISQVRDRIGFVVGEKHRRSGGHSLDFYSSHLLWLKHLKTLTATRHGEKRATGILVQANCKKNKIAAPHRKCVFPIRFGFGIDDIEASVEWLVDKGMVGYIGLKKAHVDDYLAETSELSDADYAKRCGDVRLATIKAWKEVEDWFVPPRRKYG